MKWLLERWKQFWFEPSEPTNLGLCRLLFFGIFFKHYLNRDISAWADVPDIFWMPIPLFKFFHLPVLSSELLVILDSTWQVALALSCFGLLTRPEHGSVVHAWSLPFGTAAQLRQNASQRYSRGIDHGSHGVFPLWR